MDEMGWMGWDGQGEEWINLFHFNSTSAYIHSCSSSFMFISMYLSTREKSREAKMNQAVLTYPYCTCISHPTLSNNSISY
jgi:hypothetical protein